MGDAALSTSTAVGAPAPPAGLSAEHAAVAGCAAAVAGSLAGVVPRGSDRRGGHTLLAANPESELAPLLGPGGCGEESVATPPRRRPPRLWTAASVAAAVLRPYFADDEPTAKLRAEAMAGIGDHRCAVRYLLARALADKDRRNPPEVMQRLCDVVAYFESQWEAAVRHAEWQAWLRQQPHPQPQPLQPARLGEWGTAKLKAV